MSRQILSWHNFHLFNLGFNMAGNAQHDSKMDSAEWEE